MDITAEILSSVNHGMCALLACERILLYLKSDFMHVINFILKIVHKTNNSWPSPRVYYVILFATIAKQLQIDNLVFLTLEGSLPMTVLSSF